MRTAPAGIGNPISLRTVSTATERPPPAESPAKTIFEAGIGLWRAFGGGRTRYMSEEMGLVKIELEKDYSRGIANKLPRHPVEGMARGTVALYWEELHSVTGRDSLLHKNIYIHR